MYKDEKVLRYLVEVIRKFADSLETAIKAIYNTEAASEDSVTDGPAETISELSITKDELFKAFKEKAGPSSPLLRGILQKYGYVKVSEVRPCDYEAIMKEVEEI